MSKSDPTMKARQLEDLGNISRLADIVCLNIEMLAPGEDMDYLRSVNQDLKDALQAYREKQGGD